jgi:hypothetical protein
MRGQGGESGAGRQRTVGRCAAQETEPPNGSKMSQSFLAVSGALVLRTGSPSEAN